MERDRIIIDMQSQHSSYLPFCSHLFIRIIHDNYSLLLQSELQYVMEGEINKTNIGKTNYVWYRASFKVIECQVQWILF